MEQEIIEKAKKYASSKGRSLSDLIENYLKTITRDIPENEQELSPLVKSLKGSFKTDSDFDYRSELSDILNEKYNP